MLRRLLVEYAGAVYHVMDCGDQREDIFMDDVARTYTFANSTPYRCYRLAITANQGGQSGFQLAELDLGLRKALARASDPDGGLGLRNLNAVGVASSSESRAAGPEKAVDGDEASSWYSGRTRGPVWLQVQYPIEGPHWAITQYKLISSTNASEDPRDWQLLGSNDAIDWTALDGRTNEVFASRRQARRYGFANEAPYRFYRLNITATAGGAGAGARLAEFQLWSEDTPGVATASGQNAPGAAAAMAFDGSGQTKWRNAGAGQSGWLQYEFGGGEARVLSRYSLTSAEDVPGCDPKDWRFLASNDGRAWTVLDARSNEVFAARGESRRYALANARAYRSYRLDISASQSGAGGGLQLAELNLGPLAPPNSTPRRNLNLQANALADVLGPGANPLSGAIGFTALDSETLAWCQNGCLWTMDAASRAPRLLVDIRTAAGPNTTLRSLSYSKETGRFLLSSAQGESESLWRFDPADAVSGLQALAGGGGMGSGVWIDSADHDGWVARQNNRLVLRRDAATEPARLTPRGNISAWTATQDGRRLCFVGTVKDEASAGIWECDIASGTLTNVVACTEHPWRDMQQPIHGNTVLDLPDGRRLDYDIFPPAHGYQHTHRKYPLVIGNTVFGVAMRGAHGRLWIPAVTACGAYVIVVNRADWTRGIEQWSDNIRIVFKDACRTLPIDRSQVFLFGASAETTYMRDLMTSSPGLWKGVIFLNPTGLPDFSSAPPFQNRPKILISAGGLERNEARFKRFQAEALQWGVMVDYLIHPGEGHHLVGNVSQVERTRALVRFVFDD